MGFFDLDNTAQVKNDLPPNGLIIGSRGAGRGETKTRYISIRLGAELSKKLGLHTEQQKMTVKAGNGDDAGKLALTANARGKFAAKKQKTGGYLVTIGGQAITGTFTADFEATVIAEPRFIPAQGMNGPMVVIKVPGQN